MKKIINFLLPILLVIFIPACTEDEIELPFEEGFLEFSLSATDTDSPLSRSVNGELPSNLILIVSIEDEAGNQIYNSEEFKLRKWDDSYISRPVRLTTGKYAITEYVIVDKDYQVLLASPVDGSALAYLANNPLPLTFRIFLGESTVVTPEVLEASGRSPQDFGYSQFSFEKVKTLTFEMRVFDLNRSGNTYELTPAHVRVTSNTGVELFDNDIDAELSEITIRDQYFNHIILVSKPNRLLYDTIIVKNDLRKLTSDKDGPLDVYLDDGMIFWNKLGSIEELHQSEVGPPLAVSVPNFAPAKFGNGIYATNGSQIARMAAGEFNQYIPNPLLEPWTVETWYKPNYSVENNRIVGGLSNSRYTVALLNCWKWDRSIAGIRIMPIKRGYEGPTDVYADLGYYKSTYPAEFHILQPDIIDNDVSWSAGDLVHLAVVFDPTGNDGNTRFEFYVNGVVHGHSSETQIYDYAEPTVGWPIYIGLENMKFSRVCGFIVSKV
ncbi:MAG: hypothetical protein P8X57_12020, partial [Cyclobacteriaceae bacterium]